MDNFFRVHYGYGAARLAVPAQPVGSLTVNRWQWLFHPTLMGLLGALLVAWFLRSCASNVMEPEKTVLWMHHTPETKVKKQPVRPAPAVSPRPQPAESTSQPQPEPPPAPPKLVRKQISPAPAPSLVKKQRPRIQTPETVARLAPKTEEDRMSRAIPKLPQARLTPAPTPALTPRRQTEKRQSVTSVAKPKAVISKPKRPMTPVRQPDRAPAVMEKNAKRSLYDFKPLAAATPPKLSPSAAETKETARARLRSGQKTVAVPVQSGLKQVAAADGGRQQAGSHPRPSASRGPVTDVGQGAQAVAPVAEKASSGQVGFQASSGPAVFKPRLENPQPTAARPSASAQSKAAPAEEAVAIEARIMGQSPRIESLKRTIFQKATVLEAEKGPFCCRINGIQCRLAFVSDRQIAISFSRENIPFEVLSKLERRLPEGVSSCAY